ncbi:MAG: hypothetical protein LBF90_01950 [Prevotellaceae bacterium]|jgi:hypothetical protein|nr:hypothetical protein [Prevotellaceae bacterium]
MKTKLLYLFAGIVIVIASIILFIAWLFKQPCEEWEKPSNVPISAVWKGGCDGGRWVELVRIKADTIRFRIYHDWNGTLELDADFIYENCNNLQLTKTNWVEYVSCFDGIYLYTDFVIDSRYCRLVPIFPAYYGEKVE